MWKWFMGSMVGLLLLIGIVMSMQGEAYTIKEAQGLSDGAWVVLQGKVLSVSEYPDRTFFTMSDSSGKIGVTCFAGVAVNKNDQVSVLGHVDKWKGKIQVTAEEVKRA